MPSVRTLIVDDEPLAREGIALLLGEDPDIEVIGTCSDGLAAVQAIEEQRPQLVFLDVQMPGLNGFEVVERLDPAKRPSIVFVTAHDTYALKAFETCAVDYVLKPLRDSRLKISLERVKDSLERSLDSAPDQIETLLKHLQRKNAREELAEPSRMTFRDGDGYIILRLQDIVWIEAQGNQIKLTATGQIHEVRENLQTVESRLDPKQFVRVHRSFVVNTQHVRRIISALYGDYTLVMSDGQKIRLSRSYRDKLKDLLP